MADSRRDTSLHPVHDLALLPSACAAVIRMRTSGRSIGMGRIPHPVGGVLRRSHGRRIDNVR